MFMFPTLDVCRSGVACNLCVSLDISYTLALTYCLLASFTLFTMAIGTLFIRAVHMLFIWCSHVTHMVFTAFIDILLYSYMLIVTRSLWRWRPSILVATGRVDVTASTCLSRFSASSGSSCISPSRRYVPSYISSPETIVCALTTV